jgi:hypothetical protein
VKINYQGCPIDSARQNLLSKENEFGLDDQDSILSEVILRKTRSSGKN